MALNNASRLENCCKASWYTGRYRMCGPMPVSRGSMMNMLSTTSAAAPALRVKASARMTMSWPSTTRSGAWVCKTALIKRYPWKLSPCSPRIVCSSA
ncbi:hypothetical protein D3C71_1482580 [compost metagenome]